MFQQTIFIRRPRPAARSRFGHELGPGRHRSYVVQAPGRRRRASRRVRNSDRWRRRCAVRTISPITLTLVAHLPDPGRSRPFSSRPCLRLAWNATRLWFKLPAHDLHRAGRSPAVATSNTGGIRPGPGLPRRAWETAGKPDVKIEPFGCSSKPHRKRPPGER